MRCFHNRVCCGGLEPGYSPHTLTISCFSQPSVNYAFDVLDARYRHTDLDICVRSCSIFLCVTSSFQFFTITSSSHVDVEDRTAYFQTKKYLTVEIYSIVAICSSAYCISAAPISRLLGTTPWMSLQDVSIHFIWPYIQKWVVNLIAFLILDFGGKHSHQLQHLHLHPQYSNSHFSTQFQQELFYSHDTQSTMLSGLF